MRPARLILGQTLLVQGASGGVSTALIQTGRAAGFEILTFYPLAPRHRRERQREVSSLSRFSQCDVSVCPDYRNWH